jgi:HEAT repeat protein
VGTIRERLWGDWCALFSLDEASFRLIAVCEPGSGASSVTGIDLPLATWPAIERLRDARTLPLLLELTRQGPLVPEAIMALGRFPGLAAVERLREIALTQDFRDEARRVALESLGEMGVPLAARALFDLSARLSPGLAKEALDILARRYPAELEALDALANGKASASAEGEKDGELSALLLTLHDSRFPSLQDGAALALAGLGDARAIPALAAMLDHPDPARRASALAALGKIADPLASETLARHARQTRAIEEQRACLRALIAQDTAAAAAEIVDLVWELPGVASGMVEEAEALVQRRLPERHRLRSLARASDEAVEVEILLDILSPIVARHQSGLRRAAELDADVLPAIVPELNQPRQAEWIIPWLEDRAQADARQILRDYAADRSHPLELRVRAVESLAAQPGLAGVPILEELHGTAEEALREPIRKTITRRYPDIAAARGLTWTETMPVSRAGVVPSALLMALHGAVGMYLVADASDPGNDQLVFLPVLGGAILGAGSSLLLTWKEENFTNAQAGYIASAGVWALGEAGLLGLALQSEEEDPDMVRVGKALAFATQVGGLAFGWLTRDTLGRGWGQQGYMDLSWAIGGLSGLGLSMMLDDDLSHKSAAWAMGGGLLGLALSGTLGREVKFERGDVLQTLNTMAIGAGLSALLVDSLQLDNQVAPSGAPLLGLGLGFAAGSWISAKTEVQPLLLLGIDGALVAGGLAGLGLAWQRADYSDQWDSLWVLSGSLAGLGTAGLFSRFVSFGPGDGWLVGSTALYGGGAGALIANAAQPDHERAAAGGILAGVPLGLAAGAVAATYSESRPTDLVMGNLSFLAGNLAGVGALLQFDELDGSRAPLWVLGGGAAGIAAGALFGRGLEYSGPDRLLMVEATALGGFSGFGLMRALRPEHATADYGGLALGGALGFATGAVVAAKTDGGYGAVGRAGLGFGLGGAFGAGLALSIPDLESEPFWGLLLGGAYAGLALDLATEAHTRFSPADRTLVLFGAGWGLYQGLALYGATGSASDVFGERGFWGSAILGGLGGALAAGTLAQWTEIPPSTVGRAATGGLFGSMLGLGLGLMVPELGDEGPLALSMSGGWAGLSVYAFALREARYTGADYLALGLGGGWGLFQGYLIGKASGLEGDPLSGALIFGAGMGLIAGDVFARAADLDFSEVLFTELSAYAGSGLGAGAVMLDEDAGGGTIALASSLGGWGLKTLTGLVAGKLKFRRDDTWEYFLGQAYGAWHGLGLALLGEQTDRELGAGALMGLSAGFLVPMITNQFQDYTFLQDALMAGGASLGAWIGAWGMYALANDDDSILLGALLGGDAGLLLSALALSGTLKVSDWSVGWTEITSVAGLALGVSFSSIFSKDPRVIAGGMALSTALGWAAGIIWNLAAGAPGASRRADTPPPPAPASPPPAPSAAAAAEAAVSGKERSFFPRPPVPGMFLLPPPPGNDTLSPVWMFGVQGVMDF